MPSSAESLCSRTRSKVGMVVGEKTLTWLPVVAEVRLTPMIGMLKFKKWAPAGGVSKIVTVRFAFPPPHVVQGALFDIPLHDEIKKTAATNDIERKIRFIEHPMEIRTGLPDEGPHSSAISKVLLHENSNLCRIRGTGKERKGAQVLTV